MTMKNDHKNDVDISKTGRYFVWKLFVIRFLIFGYKEFDVESIRYPQNEELLSCNFVITLLEFFLRLCKDYKITIVKAGISDYSSLPEEKKWKILNELDESKNKLLNKISIDELSFNDIKKLLGQSFKYKDEVLSNLSFRVEYGTDTIKRLKNLLRSFVSGFIEGKLGGAEFFEAPQPYTYLYQKSKFLKKLPELIRQYGYSLRISEQRDTSIFGEDTEKVRFLEVLLALEHEGYFGITEIDILDPQKYKLKDPTKQDIALDIKLNDKAIPTREKLLSYQSAKTIAPPAGWSFVIEETKAHITKDGHKVFTFPNTWSAKYRYFMCLWKNYGQKVDYKTIYEFESGLTYSGREKVWVLNRRIRDTISKLKSELEDLPINIQISKGFTFTIR